MTLGLALGLLMILLTQPSLAATFWGGFIQTQCLEHTPPGGTCVIPAGDYSVSLTINRPVRLESTGGVVRIGNMTNDPPGLPPFVAAASAPSLVVNSDLPPLLDKVVEWLLAEGVEYGLTGALIYFGMEPSTATSLASFLADELAPVIRTAILPDGTAAAGGVTLELPPSYEYCRHVIQPISINPEHDDWYLGLWEKKAPRYSHTLDTPHMRVEWRLTPQPDNTRSWLDLHTLLVGVRQDLVPWARQSGYCTPLP